MKKSIVFFALIVLAFLLIKNFRVQPAEKNYFSKTPGMAAAIGDIPGRTSFDQNWDAQIKDYFYFTSQGAQIIPYNWFVWLEQPDNTDYFRSAAHMESLRYLPSASSTANPGGLPIGFTISEGRKGKDHWLGLTCAACHTNQLDYKGHQFLIDGAPTLANFNLFFDRLIKALQVTYLNKEKFDRFAKNVLGKEYATKSAKSLRTVLLEVTEQSIARQKVNSFPKTFPGDFISYARIDAFGEIQNAATSFALGDTSNRNVPNAPVSYPFIWGTHQSDVSEYNAQGENRSVVGPLLRNVGEVIGVFGNLKMAPTSESDGLLDSSLKYTSTINIHNLAKLEDAVKDLRAPRWQENKYLPAIDEQKASKGAVLFNQDCSCCHQVVSRQNEGLNYKAVKTPLSEVGTDKAMAWNAAYYTAKTHILEGAKSGIIIGNDFKEEAPAMDIAIHGIIGLLLNDPKYALEASLMTLEMDAGEYAKKSFHDFLNLHLSMKQKTKLNQEYSCTPVDSASVLKGLVYKARPLNGIWATAPYLHNGSIPNLWELLQAPDNRITQFWVGSREFDPLLVGFEIESGLNEFKVFDNNGSIQSGNSNLGHDYGTHWTESEKWAVIEYMKTL